MPVAGRRGWETRSSQAPSHQGSESERLRARGRGRAGGSARRAGPRPGRWRESE
jgi:hypothetical protein